ncbi:hypothetical protein MMC28_005228 [Mycoblastus sanguinarius]|nr:hypothetical protein [Mycoblastus sanguinarius]
MIFMASVTTLTIATPIDESILEPRNHVQCNAQDQDCQIVQTCDNDPFIVTGSAPDPYPTSGPPIISLLTPNSPIQTAISTARKLRARQTSTIHWCALGTDIYVLLSIRGYQYANAIQTMLGTALQQIADKIATETLTDQTLNTPASGLTIKTAQQGNVSIGAGSGTIYTAEGTSTNKITASNSNGNNMTWTQLEYGLLTINDWMSKQSYGWGSASIWEGQNQVGMVYIT